MPDALPRLTSPAARLIVAFAAMFTWLLVLNAPHEGVNASLHWDAEASITWGPAVGTRAELAGARRHLYDPLDHVLHRDDPAAVTAFYWSPAGLAFHDPLTRCRYYYSYPSDLIGHAAFEAGRRAFGTPTAAVWCYQLAAMAITAGTWAVVLAVLRAAGGPRWVSVLTVAALSSAPVMLSVARQVLQETPGFAFAVATLACVGLAARRQSVAWAAVAAAAAFLTVRCRYTLGPMIGLLLPLVWGMYRRPGRSAYLTTGLGQAGAFGGVVALLVGLDWWRFGPMGMPWEYDAVMVRSSRLFFHADPPYRAFLVALFVNAPLLLVPLIGVGCWVDGGRSSARARAYGAAVIAVLGVLLWRTAEQQVQYQPRHLFAVAAGAVLLWLLVLPRVGWRPATLGGYASVAAFFLVWNVCSTFGSQRNHTLGDVPDVATVVDRHLAGATGGRLLAVDVWPAYYDWADGRLLHDTLRCWTYLHRQPGRPRLAIDAAAATANQMMLYAAQFPAFDWAVMHGRGDADLLRSGRPTWLLTAPGRRPPAGLATVGPPVPIDLMHVALRPVTSVARGVELNAGTDVSASADGLTITRVRGQSRRFDAAHGWLPRVQQEWLSYDGDRRQVAYDVAGLVPGRRYAVGFVTWDADRAGRAVRVSADGVTVGTAVAVGGVAPADVAYPLPAAGGRVRVTFDNAARGDVAVCDVWVFEVADDAAPSVTGGHR